MDEIRTILAKLVGVLALHAVSVGLGIAGLIYGWGLTVQSLSAILWVAVAQFLLTIVTLGLFSK